MCKIMVLKGIQNSAMALEFMKAVAPTMSIANTDGIGYSAINSKNKLFSEKWHNNKYFLDTDYVLDQKTLDELKIALEPFGTRIPKINMPELNYKSYGDVTREDLRTVTMHTRFATCGKTFENTHPFIDHEMSLIHNGVISNHYVLGLNKVSTCDSENALQLYKNQDLNLQSNTENFQAFVDRLRGYWAFAFLAKDGDGNYMLDVVREGASLHWTLVPEMGEDCVVFATTTEIIETGLKEIGLPPREKIWVLSESNYHRFNAVTGEFIDNHILEESALNGSYYSYPNGYSKKWNNKKTETTKEDIKIVKEVEPTKETDLYDGYQSDKSERITEKKFKEAMQGISDDLTIESFYDVDELLVDRLYNYDKLMGTSYGTTYEDIPVKVKLFMETKEEEDYIVFDHILQMIESYQEKSSVLGIYKIFREKKRA